MDGKTRANIKKGTCVLVVQKQDQRSGELTQGTVKNILTKSSTHSHGIKVRLETGVVGRIKNPDRRSELRVHLNVTEVKVVLNGFEELKEKVPAE